MDVHEVVLPGNDAPGIEVEGVQVHPALLGNVSQFFGV